MRDFLNVRHNHVRLNHTLHHVIYLKKRGGGRKWINQLLSLSSVKCLLFLNYGFPVENSLNFSRTAWQIKISLDSPVPCSYYLKNLVPRNSALSLMSGKILRPYLFTQTHQVTLHPKILKMLTLIQGNFLEYLPGAF